MAIRAERGEPSRRVCFLARLHPSLLPDEKERNDAAAMSRIFSESVPVAS